MERRLLSVKELSEYLGLSINTIYSWVSQRKLPYVKVGRLTKFDLMQIDRWIGENTKIEHNKGIKKKIVLSGSPTEKIFKKALTNQENSVIILPTGIRR
jgi:excisionase family DNA binding protein